MAITLQELAHIREREASIEKRKVVKRTLIPVSNEPRKKAKAIAKEGIKMSSAPRSMRNILQLEKPTAKSALNTITAIPPPICELTAQEKEMIRTLDGNIFRTITPIKIDMWELLTKEHPNPEYIKKLNTQCKHDINWWLKLLPEWSGIYLLEEMAW